MINLLDGKTYAKEIRKEIKEKIEKDNLKLKLVVIQVGEDKASSTYVKNKSKACTEVGIDFEDIHFNKDISRKEFLHKIMNLNDDDSVNGILIQQPIPAHLQGVEQFIVRWKDVDGFTYENQGEMMYNKGQLLPCTPYGIIELLKHYNIEIKGKHVVIIGRSNIVGKPLSQMLLNENATVTICHSYTQDLKEITQQADILITAIGKPNFIDYSFIGNKTKVIIDVGINRNNENKICGDCNFEDITNHWEKEDINKYITPVPGGIGPLTIAFLLKNILNTLNYKYY